MRTVTRPGFESARDVLRLTFGHDDFRGRQWQVVRAMLGGRDVAAVLPTGTGKSVCYQLPGIVAGGTTVVISPLIALMQDQVAALRRHGVVAGAWNSTIDERDRRSIENRMAAGGPYLVYASPEGLRSMRFRRACPRPVRVVVDEAHCISEWGHDFRPAYRLIPEYLAAVGSPPVASFTATATPATRRDIEMLLGLRRPVRIVESVDRPTLGWRVHRIRTVAEALNRTAGLLAGSRGSAAIVYVQTRAMAVGGASALGRRGLRARAYHAGLPADRRMDAQTKWLAGEADVMCATSAFGMGIDHPAVRNVVHIGMPGALESYVQEAGRAGRDGGHATCSLFALPGDVAFHASRIRSQPRRHRRRSRARLAAMRGYVRTRGCRRARVAVYFGESPPPCRSCDRCGEKGGNAGHPVGRP